jgi:ABC-2 type transport system permease protein
MRKTLLIAAREYSAAVRTKAFIIGMAIAPILMFGSIMVMVYMDKRADTTDKTIAVVDRSCVVAPAIIEAAKQHNEHEIFDEKSGKQIQPRYIIELVAPNDADPDAQLLALSNRVRSKELHAFVQIGRDAVTPGEDPARAQIAYYAENSALADARRWIANPINNQIRRLRLAEQGVDPRKVESALAWMPVEGMGLVSVDEATGEVKEAQRTSEGVAFGVPYAMLMMLFLMIMIGASPLINSVMEEKMQRISEVLLGSARPFEIMMGKLIGNLGVSFTAAVVYLGAGSVVAYRMGWSEHIPLHILPWFFAYLVTAIFMYGALNIAVGASCNDAKEAQSMAMPIMLPFMIPMFMLVPIIKEPEGTLATVMSLIPPFTPMVMLMRQSTPVGVPVWQPWVGMVGVVAFAVFCVWVGGRIFRVGLLMQGQPPTLRNLIRWAVRG